MELHYRAPKIVPASDPWDEAFIGFNHPPGQFIESDGKIRYRLIPELRQAAQTKDPVQILARAAEAFFFANNLAETILDKQAAIARGNAFADLAVSGRASYDAFRLGVDPADVRSATRPLLQSQAPVPAFNDEQIDAATGLALDRAYDVAWALRGPVSQQSALRARLGWIAVSGEDDRPHRPVNLPPVPYEQYEIAVSSQGNTFTTRFFIASAVEGRSKDEQKKEPRVVPRDPALPQRLPAGHEAILFIHGHSSGAEEALAIIPELLRLGLERNKRYSVIALDLPNNGYSQSFDHLSLIAPLTATTYPKDPADNTPIATPILDFIETFIVDFIDSLPPAISSRLAAIIGGSLGGNLALRLGRRDLSNKLWRVPAIVAWSPASVWPALVQDAFKYLAPNRCFDRCRQTELPLSRSEFFSQVYEDSEFLGNIELKNLKPQPEYWYRRDWALKAFNIAQSKFARFEIYDANYRQWHWRVAGEQLIFSHVDNEIHGDETSPLRYTKNTVRTLLVAGGMDNYEGTSIYDNTASLAENMTATPGRRLLMVQTGHSIHFERPRYFANEIVKFLAAQTRYIVCVTTEDGKIVSYGVKRSRNANTSEPMTLDACIQAIQQGDDFYAVSADGNEAYVIIAHSGQLGPHGDEGGKNGGYYLRTVGDSTTANNLSSLLECDP
jgi:pimeloyl-ACP methyl ester carboxylesterase